MCMTNSLFERHHTAFVRLMALVTYPLNLHKSQFFYQIILSAKNPIYKK
jgi:hypothetical protein